MANGNKVGIEGGKELAEKFKKISREVSNDLEQALVTGALRVERDAKKNAPVDTGRLRSSISHRLFDDENGNPVAEVGTSVNVLPKKNRAKTVKANVEVGTLLCYN
jgi:hypothetical protein